MFSPAYNEAVKFAAAVVQAVKASGYVIDYPLEQLISESARIGEKLLLAEVSQQMVSSHTFQSNMEASYKDGIKYSHLSLYWMDILEESGSYDQIPFASIREKCESLQGVLRSGMKAIELLLGKDRF